jgi:lantibiotic biosynthesis dehydratase-like protein
MSDQPPHLVDIGEGWGLWRWFVLRSAGFPDAMALELATSETARAIDRLLTADADAERARLDLGLQLAGAANAKQLGGAWAKQRAKLLRRAAAGEAVEPDGLPPELIPSLRALREAGVRVIAARTAARAAWETDEQAVHATLRRIAGDARLVEAVAWQNPGAVRSALDSLAEGAASGYDRRKRERLVTSYLQRFCVKADTIGFFGPFSWGFVSPAGPPLVARPGPSLIAERTTSFEYWAIDALAQALSARVDLRPWVAPRRRSTVRLDGSTAHVGEDRMVTLDRAAAHLLAACDGVRTARALAAAHPDLDVPAILARLEAEGLITWAFEVPACDDTGSRAFPERGLRRLLEAAEDTVARAGALAALDELELARDHLAGAAGDGAAVLRASDNLNQVFRRLTERAAHRGEGAVYAARNIVYQDCVRDLELTVGPGLLESIRDPLRLVLLGARWYMHGLTSRLLALCEQVYRAQCGGDQPQAIPFLRLWKELEPQFSPGSAIALELQRELRARWTAVIAAPPGARRVELSFEALRDRVRAAFPAPHSGAASIRYHTPDLGVAAESVEAIARGECLFVLSELHAGAHTYAMPMDFDASANRDELVRARAVDLPYPEIFPMFKKEHHIRTNTTTYKPNDLHYEDADARSWLPRERVMTVGDLYFDREGDVLCVKERGTGRAFDAVSFLSYQVIRAGVSTFRMALDLDHCPRVTLGRLVLVRESWRIPSAAIPFHGIEDPLERFVSARRWARELDLPRFVFVRVPEEAKPFFLDFESAAYVELIAKVLRSASQATISEMLPSFGESWLADREGRRYVCEVRIAAVDPECPAPTIFRPT